MDGPNIPQGDLEEMLVHSLVDIILDFYGPSAVQGGPSVDQECGEEGITVRD